MGRAALLTFAAFAAPALARDASDCTGLVPPPALPQAVEATLQGSADLCEIGGTDGQGNFVFERVGGGVIELHLFSADGRATGSSSFSGKLMPAIGRSAFLGQAEGYLVPFSGLGSSTQQITQVLVGFAPDGSTTGQTVIEDGPFGPEQHLVVADPRGGALLVDVTTAPGSAPRPESPWSIAVRRVSASGVQIEGPRVLEVGSRRIPTIAAQVDAGGSLLLLSAGFHFPPLRNNQLAGRWFDPSSGPLTPWFVTLDQVVGETGETFPARNGAVGVHLGERRAIVRARAASTEPTPPWLPGYLPSLVQLPDRTAVVSSTNEPCADHIEIRAPAGNLCGAVEIPAGTRGGYCQSGLSLTVGRDGTVLQRTSNGNPCSVRWWRRLLQ
jgi:hypothetical protein